MNTRLWHSKILNNMNYEEDQIYKRGYKDGWFDCDQEMRSRARQSARKRWDKLSKEERSKVGYQFWETRRKKAKTRNS